MFVEPHFDNSEFRPKTGWLEVIAGSMFSGKTEELIRRLNRAKIAKQQIQIFKPSIDQRYHAQHVVSHNSNAIFSTPVEQASRILTLSESADVVGIDEVQFFDASIVQVCTQLANQGKRVIVAGLDLDFKAKPFGSMPQLMAVAEFVTKLHAICMRCGGIANFSYRLVASQEKVLLGETEAYEARCRRCFYTGDQEKSKIHPQHEIQ